MRFDPTGGGRTAADLLRDLSEGELEALLRELADEPHARRIARAVARQRREAPLTRTAELAQLVAEVVPPPRGRDARRIHPATRTFQALRMATNREIEGLGEFVRDAATTLAPRGRLAIIAFHGGEDRIVKNELKDLAGRCTCPPELARCECGRRALVSLITRKPVRPSEEEASRNPRARSARLRAAEKLAA